MQTNAARLTCEPTIMAPQSQLGDKDRPGRGKGSDGSEPITVALLELC
jgi:hypothetical protein